MKLPQAFILGLIVAAPLLTFAASPHNFRDLAGLIVTLLNAATAVLIVASIAIYFYGVSTNILKFGESNVEKLKNYFFWGIIVLFVMMSIWGILGLLRDTFLSEQTGSSTNTVNSTQTFSL